MPVNPEKTVRKNVALPRELWEKVSAWLNKQGLKSESKALTRLIQRGLDAEHQGKSAKRRP